MINPKTPETWQQLQTEAGRILSEIGWKVEIEKKIKTARGSVEVDVFAINEKEAPPIVYLLECKHWKNSVPKTVVHSLRTVVNDFGANWGLLISSKGFQKGAVEAAKFSNIKLFNWEEFEKLFEQKWYDDYFVTNLFKNCDPLIEYTEYINSRIFKKADKLSSQKQEQFKQLRIKYNGLAALVLATQVSNFLTKFRDYRLTLPLPKEAKIFDVSARGEYSIPEEFYGITSYREFLEVTTSHAQKAIAEFDEIFGERA